MSLIPDKAKRRFDKVSISLGLQIIAITAILLMLAWQMLSPLHFLMSDTALRFRQVEQLVTHNWQTLGVDYPQQQYDPEFQYVPHYTAFSAMDGRLWFHISPYVPIVASFFYWALGAGGLGIVPVIGAVLTAVALYKLARLARLPYAPLLLWITIFATPILFYSVKLWDHTTGTAFSTWAVYFIARGLQDPLSRRHLLAGGICLGLGLGQRPELYAFVLAIAASFLLVYWPNLKAGFIVATGGLIGALPIWLTQWLWVGHPLGMFVAPHFLGYGRTTSEVATATAASVAVTTVATVAPKSLHIAKIGHFIASIQPQDHWAALAMIAILSGALLLFFAVRALPRYAPHLLVGALLLLLAGYGVWLYYSTWSFLRGLIPAFPLIVFVLIYPNQDGRMVYSKQIYRFVLLTASLFLALMFAFWPTFGGEQWGSRYLLPVYPLLLYLALFAFASYEQFLAEATPTLYRSWRVIGVSLLIVSVLLQISSVRTLRLYQNGVGKIQEEIDSLPAEIILTNHRFFPSVMIPLSDKQFFYVNQKEDIEKLAQRFAAGGVRQIAIIPGTYFIPEHPPLEIPDRAGDVILREVEPLIYELR
jgi:hypothetical protein